MNQSNKGCGCKDCQAKFGMPDELKAKLLEIIEPNIEMIHNEFGEGDKKAIREYADESIAKIDQAYKDAGWSYHPETVHLLKNIKRTGLMTGQEWFIKLCKELDKWDRVELKTKHGTADFMALEQVMECAKRAAGLEE